MEHALAVIDAREETKQLVREAGELAAGVDADLTLLYGTTEDEYSEQRMELQTLSNYDATYSISQARSGARNFAEDVGREVLDDIDVEWEAVGAIGEKGSKTLEVAERRGCDHVFISGARRSPTGKALFGDDTQQVILEFEGPVTVLTI